MATSVSGLETSKPTVAVLQFACVSNELAWTANALPDLISARLGTESTVNVLDRDFIQSVLSEQGLKASGFLAPETLMAGKLRLADFLVLGEVSAGAGEALLTLRIVRTAVGTVEKTAVIKGRLPKELDAMVDSAAAAVTEVVVGARPVAAKTDSRLARVPEAIESFYRALSWSAQGRPLRAAPYFAEAFNRDNQFVLAKVRERGCYERAGLPRYVAAIDAQLKKANVDLAIPAMAPLETGKPVLLLHAYSGTEIAGFPEALTAFENALIRQGTLVVGKENVTTRTAELDLTLSGKFDPKHVPAYRDLAVATAALGIRLTRGANNQIDVSALLTDALSGAVVTQAQERVAGEEHLAAAFQKLAAPIAAAAVAGQKQAARGETRVDLNIGDDGNSLSLDEIVASVTTRQAAASMNTADAAGLLLEVLVRDPEKARRAVLAPVWGAWYFDMLNRGAFTGTIMDRIFAGPFSYEQAEFLFENDAGGGELAARFPGTPVAYGAHFRQGFLYLGEGSYEKAAKAYQDALNCLPTVAGVDDKYWAAAAKGTGGYMTRRAGDCVHNWRAGAEFCRAACLLKMGRAGEAAAAWRELKRSLEGKSAGVFTWFYHRDSSDEQNIDLLVEAAAGDPAGSYSGNLVEALAAGLRDDWNRSFELLAEAAMKSSAPYVAVKAASKIIVYYTAYPEERRRAVADALLKAMPEVVGKYFRFSAFDNELPMAIGLLARDPATAATLRDRLLAIEKIYHSLPDDQRRREQLATRALVRAYGAAGLPEEQMRFCDKIVERDLEANDYSRHVWEAIGWTAVGLRKQKNEAAELAFLRKWAAWRDPVTADNTSETFHWLQIVEYAAYRFQERGKFKEAADLYEKLSRVHEQAKRIDAASGPDLTKNDYVMLIRGRNALRRGECLEKLGDIDGAVAIYKQVAKDYTGKATLDGRSKDPFVIIPYMPNVSLDASAVKHLEALRARQENAKTQPEKQ